MDPQLYPWIILFTPLAAAGVILFVFSQKTAAAGTIAVLAAGLTCFLSWRVFLDPALTVTAQIPWIEIRVSSLRSHRIISTI